MPDTTRESLKAGAAAAVDEISGELVALSHRIHANPELGFQEIKASALLVQSLEDHGFAVEVGVAGMPTAFLATKRGLPGGPTVALLAEYDALPGMGHACGHNIIGTAAAGAGIAAGKVIGGLRGTVQVIGTPAEEGGGGKVIMVKEGMFAGVDAAMMVHPSNRTMVTRGSLAFSDLKLEFFGKPAHAAMAPEDGINALDACIITFVNVNALRQHVKSDVRIHGIITSGGTAVNIVPEYASATFMVRAREREMVDQVMARVQTCARAAAEAAGARVTMHVTKGYDDIRVNRTLAGAFRANWESLGEPVLEPPTDGRMGSVDMGNVSYVTPAIHPYICIAPDGVANHTHEFRECAASPAGDRGLLLAAKGMAMTAIDLLTDAELLARIKDEFQNESA
jgi:amidohydrolase